MFKTERQQQDTKLTPDQRTKMAMMDTICRGDTSVGLHQPITAEQRDMACFFSRHGRRIILDQPKVRQNPNWVHELASEVKKAGDQHRGCERRVRQIQIENEAARVRGQALKHSAAVDSRYGFCDREYNIAIFSANLKYGVDEPEKSVRE
jgi:hypothetical protein